MDDSKRILVVVDMQNDFIDGSLGSKEAEAIVPAVVELIRNWDGVVIATRDTHPANYMQTTEGRHLPVEHCICGTKGWEINSEVAEALAACNCSAVIDKPTFGSVSLVDTLAEYLSDTDFGSGAEITLCGLCTDICVVSNALLLKASYPEAEFFVHAGCCAGTSVERHNAALETMKSCHVIVL